MVVTPEIAWWATRIHELSDEQREHLERLVNRLEADPHFLTRFVRDREHFKELFFEERFAELDLWFDSSYH